MLIMSEAYNILKKVILEHGYCNVLIAKMMQKNLTYNNKHKIDNLVRNTLKNEIFLNYILNKLIKKLEIDNINSFHLEFKIFLWLILYKLYFEKIENYEKFKNLTVKIVKILNKSWEKPVILIVDYLALHTRPQFDLDQEKQITRKLIKFSFPQYLFELLTLQFSSEIANEVMKDSYSNPKISFRVNLIKIATKKILNNRKYKNYNFHLSKLASDGIISDKQVLTTNLYKTGKIIKQDQASMLVTHILNPVAGELIWDMCAGIGSKTAHIAALTNNQSNIYATDIDKDSLQLAKEYFKKLSVTNAKIIHADATKWNTDLQFDKIMIDAPSTAFGLIKRKPELKLISWTKEMINELVNIQFELLVNAYKNLKMNGHILYITNTFNIEENQNQIEKIINTFPDLIIIKEQQIFGFHENCDGLYFCKLKKVG